jgi:hypothetical protein
MKSKKLAAGGGTPAAGDGTKCFEQEKPLPCSPPANGAQAVTVIPPDAGGRGLVTITESWTVPSYGAMLAPVPDDLADAPFVGAPVDPDDDISDREYDDDEYDAAHKEREAVASKNLVVMAPNESDALHLKSALDAIERIAREPPPRRDRDEEMRDLENSEEYQREVRKIEQARREWRDAQAAALALALADDEPDEYADVEGEPRNLDREMEALLRRDLHKLKMRMWDQTVEARRRAAFDRRREYEQQKLEKTAQHAASVIASGADARMITHGASRALAVAAKDSTQLVEWQRVAGALVALKGRTEPIKTRFSAGDLGAISAFVLRARGIAEQLAFGSHRKRFYLVVGPGEIVELATARLDGWIQETLSATAEIEDYQRIDRNSGKYVRVPIDNKLVGEIRGQLMRRRVVNDGDEGRHRGRSARAIELTAPRVPALAPPAPAAPAFDEVLMIDDGAPWIDSGDIRRACDGIWRAWCVLSIADVADGRLFGRLLNRWGGNAVQRKHGPRQGTRRPWGYVGLRLK